MGAGIAASPHCAESWISRCSLRGWALGPSPFTILAYQLRRRVRFKRRFLIGSPSPRPDWPAPLAKGCPVEIGSAVARLPGFLAKALLAATSPCGVVTSLRLSSSPAVRLFHLAVSNPDLPEPRTEPGVLRPPDHRLSFRGPSWDDRSSRRPVRSEDRSFVRSEEDHLFRRLLPTSLSGDPPRDRRHPGEAFVPVNSTPAPSPAEIGCLVPFQLFPVPCGSGPFRPGLLPPITLVR